jgi:hypothetical protein
MFGLETLFVTRNRSTTKLYWQILCYNHYVCDAAGEFVTAQMLHARTKGES